MSDKVVSTENEAMKNVIHDILNDAGIKSETDALKNQALMITLAKINKYVSEISIFRDKYKLKFEEFEKKLRKQKNRKTLKWRMITWIGDLRKRL